MSGSPKKGSSGSRGSQYRRVCKNKSLITLRDGDNAGEGWHGQKRTHMEFMEAGLFSSRRIWGNDRESKSGWIAGRNGMGLSHLRGLRTTWESSPSDTVFLGGVFVPLFFFFSSCFLRYSRLTRLSHALWNFQHYVHFFYFQLET